MTIMLNIFNNYIIGNIKQLHCNITHSFQEMEI